MREIARFASELTPSQPFGACEGKFWGTLAASWQNSEMYTVVPQTVLALRGSNGVGIEGAMFGGWICSWTRSLIFVAI